MEAEKPGRGPVSGLASPSGRASWVGGACSKRGRKGRSRCRCACPGPGGLVLSPTRSPVLSALGPQREVRAGVPWGLPVCLGLTCYLVTSFSLLFGGSDLKWALPEFSGFILTLVFSAHQAGCVFTDSDR